MSGYFDVVMPNGASEVTVPIRIIDDTQAEPTETFAFSIVYSTGGTLWAPRTSRISILDNERVAPPPPVEPPLISDYVVNPVTVLQGIDSPIRLVASPVDPNKLYVAEKPGIISIADITTGQLSTFLDISGRTNNHTDRGLLSIALHPDFINNPYVYAFVVIDPADGAGLTANAGPDGAGNRYSQVLRFTADAANGYRTALPGSEKVLLGGAGQSLQDISGGGWFDYTNPTFANEVASDRLINQNPARPTVVVNGIKQDYLKVDSSSHAGGALAFGPDGALYVSVGDGTSFDFADPRTLDVQSLDSLSGKILRIDPLTGQGLTTNPFITEGLSLDSDRAKIFQYGVRNPFSMTFTDDGRLMITDTGWNSWEELNSGGPGTNFGWPFYEGADGGVSTQTPGYKNINGAQSFYSAVANGTVKVTAPFRGFSHDSADPGFKVQAITGSSVVYDGAVYPASLANRLIFEDFASGNVFAVDVNDRSKISYLYTASSGYAPVDFVQAANGYVYAADVAFGRIQRLEISAVAPPPPPPPPPPPGAGTNTPLGAGPDSLVVKLFQEAYLGNAQYNVSVDGVQFNVGALTVNANSLLGSGTFDTVTLRGTFAGGPHTVTVNFLNDAWGGTPTTDRNLHVAGITYDDDAVAGGPVAVANSVAALNSTGPLAFAFTDVSAVAPPPPPPPPPPPGVGTNNAPLGAGPDSLVVKLTQEAYLGNAQYNVSVDGVQFNVGALTVNANSLLGSGTFDTVTLRGTFAGGPHTVTVNFLNDAWGGTPTTDRNLHVAGITYDDDAVAGGPVAVANSVAALNSTGPLAFAFTDVSAVAPPPPPPPPGVGTNTPLGAGPDSLVVKLTQDAYLGNAQYNVSVDGVQFNVGALTANANSLHGSATFDTVTLLGNFAGGQHSVAVNFLNDAYGGTATTDRNLYVVQASIDGTAVPGASLVLARAGTQSFGFTGPGSAPAVA